LKGKQFGDRTFKNHLDSYNQPGHDHWQRPSARHEIFYFTESSLAAVRIDDFQISVHRAAWRLALGTKDHPDVPTLVICAGSLRAHDMAERQFGEPTHILTGTSSSFGRSCLSNRKWRSCHVLPSRPAYAEGREFQS